MGKGYPNDKVKMSKKHGSGARVQYPTALPMYITPVVGCKGITPWLVLLIQHKSQISCGQGGKGRIGQRKQPLYIQQCNIFFGLAMSKDTSALRLELGNPSLSSWKRNKTVLPSVRPTCPFPFLTHMLTTLRYQLNIATYACKDFQLRCIHILLQLPEWSQLCSRTALPQSLNP